GWRWDLMVSRNHRAGTIGLSITGTITGAGMSTSTARHGHGTARHDYGHGQAEGPEQSDADEGLADRG
ncbi:MAG: hypothetical protein ACOYOZ_11570, partial [Pirellula sp.]